MAETFRALLLTKENDAVAAGIADVDAADLPEGDVTVAVDYSTLNYKDGMILKGLGNMVRNYPHIPGVDFAGTVMESDSADYAPGDNVILTGWRVGESHWGGYGALARVNSAWLVPMPAGLDTKRAMAIGTAGLTAMLAVMALEDHGLTPDSEGEVLVTGAAGGVGSVAVAILAHLGYAVAASTGREEQHGYLTDLGAASIVPRAELEAPTKGPLASERWAGAIDNVAGPILAHLLAELRRHACCAAVGLAATPKLETTVVPFLLRGINLLGIDSVMCPKPRRVAAWDRLVTDLPMDKLDAATNVVALSDVAGLADDILAGKVRGRTVVDIGA